MLVKVYAKPVLPKDKPAETKLTFVKDLGPSALFSFELLFNSTLR